MTSDSAPPPPAGGYRRTAPVPSTYGDLPPPPYGSGYRPGPDQLLKEPSQSRPERNVDARVRSEQRADDPYNLPPEN